jgi:hypothetical protein
VRPHIQIAGTGDRYQWTGRSLAVSGVPIAEAQVQPPRHTPAPRTSATFARCGPPDPDLERERAAIGAVILGWTSAAAVWPTVAHPTHQPLLEALALVNLDAPSPAARLSAAIQGCRSQGVDPVLCGGEDAAGPFGYLAGCVWSARQLGPEAFEGVPMGAQPGVEEDPAEAWER